MTKTNISMSPVAGLCCIVLALIFVGLRLLGVVTWSWAWVLGPLWIPILLGFFLGFLSMSGVLRVTHQPEEKSDG